MNRFIKRALFLLAFLVWSTTVFAQGGNPTFIIEKQVGQATGLPAKATCLRLRWHSREIRRFRFTRGASCVT